MLWLFVRRLGLTLPLWIVAGWSAAEAALFFLVADIPISWIAVRHGPRAGLLAAAVAAIASVAGTLVVLVWAGRDASGAAVTMAALPGIDPALIGDAVTRYHHGLQAVLVGSFSGIPFKLFALQAARSHDLPFVLMAPFLRLPRFAAVALLAGGIGHAMAPRIAERSRLALLAAAWLAFYAFYFSVMPR